MMHSPGVCGGAGDREGVALQLSPTLGELCRPGLSLRGSKPSTLMWGIAPAD